MQVRLHGTKGLRVKQLAVHVWAAVYQTGVALREKLFRQK
jgi:hypothetical protein